MEQRFIVCRRNKKLLSIKLKGVKKNPFTDEHRRKLSLAKIGTKRTFSDEHRRNLSKAVSISQKGVKWFTDGIRNVRSRECPEGFHNGRTIK